MGKIDQGLHPEGPCRQGSIVFRGKPVEPVPLSIVDAVGTAGFRRAAADDRLQDLVLARAYEQALGDLAKRRENGDE